MPRSYRESVDLLQVSARPGSRPYSEPGAPDIFAMFATRPPWMAQAACRGHDTRDWYPSRGDSRLTSTVNAKTICQGCPVLGDCLAYVLAAHPTELGIWAGLSEKQRKLLRRGPTATRRKHGTRTNYQAGCRCDPCRRANTEAAAANRRSRAKGAA